VPHPAEVTVSQTSDALVAQADAKGALNSLFLGLGVLSLLIGAIAPSASATSCSSGCSNAAPRSGCAGRWAPPRVTSASNSSPKPCLLALLGGAVCVGFGAAATAVYARTQHWATVISGLAGAGGLAAGLAIGAIAGLPALRAARMSPPKPSGPVEERGSASRRGCGAGPREARIAALLGDERADSDRSPKSGMPLALPASG
jgi:putative ABC transport system permease protein